MTVYIVATLKEGVKNPPEPYEVPIEILERVEAEFRAEYERKQAERYCA